MEVIDFKTVSLTSNLDTSIGANLELKASSKVSGKVPEDFEGFVCVYLNISIHDKDDKYFLFDITTETVVKLDDGITELTDELMQEMIPLAQEKTYEAIRGITVAMGINELDLTAG